MMAQLKTKYERENGHSYTYDEIEEMRPTAWRPDGTPTKFEIVQREPTAPRVIGADDDVQHIVSPLPAERVVRSSSHVEGGYEDRARGFAIATWQLSVVTGAGMAIAALVLGGSFSFVALTGWFFAGFCLVWLASFILHTFVSAEGSEFLSTVFLWRFLFAEQRHRHNRYAQPPSERLRTLQTIVLALAVAASALFVVLIVALVFMENAPR